MRIALAGPLLPLSGGIAQHTTLLHRALIDRCELMTVGYRSPYPRWIGVGTSDWDHAPPRRYEINVDYTLAPLSPRSWFRTAHRIAAHRPHLVVIPWWSVAWAPSLGFLSLWLKRKNIPLLFICHDVSQIDAPWPKNWLTRQTLRTGTYYLTHAEKDLYVLRERFRSASSSVYHPHPTYGQFTKPADAAETSQAFQLLFFGYVCNYKGLDVLAAALDLLRIPLRVTIAGQWRMKDPDLYRRLAENPRVRLLPYYQNDRDVSSLFHHCDAVVLPYRSATTSGVVPLARHFARPVIATRVGNLSEMVQDGVTGKLVPAEDPAALARAIESLASEDRSKYGAAIAERARTATWEGLAEKILEAATKGENL